MGKLIITEASGATSEWVLDKERVSIGRHADNDVCLNDKAVSGHHAVIITILSDLFLEDLDSTNGTLVNSRQVAKHPLSNGDTVTIGRNSLRYQTEEKADSEDSKKTTTLQPAQLAAVANTAAGGTDNRLQTGTLRVESGANAGREMALTKALTTIGKPGVQVAAITRRAEGFCIVHVGGVSGGKRPLLNGQEIDTQACKLNHKDLIDLAGTQMRFLLT